MYNLTLHLPLYYLVCSNYTTVQQVNSKVVQIVQRTILKLENGSSNLLVHVLLLWNTLMNVISAVGCR